VSTSPSIHSGIIYPYIRIHTSEYAKERSSLCVSVHPSACCSRGGSPFRFPFRRPRQCENAREGGGATAGDPFKAPTDRAGGRSLTRASLRAASGSHRRRRRRRPLNRDRALVKSHRRSGVRDAPARAPRSKAPLALVARGRRAPVYMFMIRFMVHDK